MDKVTKRLTKFLKEVKGLKTVAAISFSETISYYVVADHFSIFDKSEDFDVPAVYYVISRDNFSNWFSVRFFYSSFVDEEPSLSLDDNDLRQKVARIFNSEGNLTDTIIPEEVYDAINSLANEFIRDEALDAEVEMVSPGYPTVRYLSNGDPGYPGADPEYEITCPHCGNLLDFDSEGTFRCDECKKFISVNFEEDDGCRDDYDDYQDILFNC